MWFRKSSSASSKSSKSSETQSSISTSSYSKYASYSTPSLLVEPHAVPYAPAKAFKKSYGIPLISKQPSLPKVKIHQHEPLVAGPTSVSRRKATYRDDHWVPTKRCVSCEGDNVIDPSQVGKYVACQNVYFGIPCPGHFHVTQRDALKAKKSREFKDSFDFMCSGDEHLKRPKVPKERWPDRGQCYKINL